MVGPSRRRTRQPEIRPDQILDAAQTMLLGPGPSALTMDALAEAAGVGKGTIYHYFASKADVLAALRQRYLAHAVEVAGAAVSEAAGTALERVERFVGALLGAAKEDAGLIWILFHQVGGDDDELGLLFEPLLALIDAGVRSGEFTLGDPEFSTRFILHGLHGTVEDAFHGQNVDPGVLHAQLNAAIRSVLAASP